MARAYPFVSIVGQDDVKEALLLNLVNPKIGGVLISGEKGTAKSTIVRALGELSNKKVIDLPLNTTEDMLVGSIDFESAIKVGKRKFSAGILKRADENILYVDEINLLSDGLATSVICAAASGENIVEREGISYKHKSEFVLIGTMNPEEGGLRPQLLDKFGLFVSVAGEKNIDTRMEIIKRRLEYENDNLAFCQKYEAETLILHDKINKAINLIKQVKVEDAVRKLASQYVIKANAIGNRAEIVLIQTAITVAALDGRIYVTAEDIKIAAKYVLPHRMNDEAPTQNQPQEQEEQEENQEEQEEQSDEENEQDENDGEPENSNSSEENQTSETESSLDEDNQVEPDENDKTQPPTEGNMQDDEVVEGEEVYDIITLPTGMRDRLARKGSGHRKKTVSNSNKGRYAGFAMNKKAGQTQIALDATLRAAAPYQNQRAKNGCAVTIEDSDFRYQKKESHVGATIVFVVDASGSMNAKKRMKETKEAVLSMLMDSYQKRDKIGMVAFRKNEAEVLLQITTSADLAQKQLQQLPTGGRTPLASGLYSAWELLRARRRKDPEMTPLVVLITDGRANASLWSDDPVEDALKAARLIANDKISAIVIDTEKDFISFEIAKKVANALDGEYFKVEDLKSKQLSAIVNGGRFKFFEA